MSEPKPTMELVLVTPEMAADWLKLNLRNRRLREERSAAYAAIIAAEDWMITGEAVKFDWDGRLIDGQHRLGGVVASGKAVWIFVVRDLHPDVQYVLDTGMKRTAADALKFAGVEGSLNAVAAAARLAILWADGRLKYSTQSQWSRDVTNVEIVEWVADNPDIHDAVRAADSLRRQSPVPSGPGGFAALLFRRLSIEDAERFFGDIAQLRTGGQGDPIYSLLRRYQSAKDRREALGSPQHLFLLFRTWNAWRKGEELHHLKMGRVSVSTAGRGGERESVRIEIPVPE